MIKIMNIEGMRKDILNYYLIYIGKRKLLLFNNYRM